MWNKESFGKISYYKHIRICTHSYTPQEKLEEGSHIPPAVLPGDKSTPIVGINYTEII